MDGPVFELALASWILLSGTASQYDPGIMQVVIANRQAGLTEIVLPADLPETDGWIAVENCGDIGQVWYVQNPDGEWESFLVVDCAQPAAAEWMRDNNIIIEIDAATAERWDTIGAGVGVQVIRRK